MLPLDAIATSRTVKTRLGATSKYDAIQELLDLLVGSNDLAMRRHGAARDSVFKNERARASGCDTGVAVPYGVVDGLTAPKCAIGVSEEGIDFGARTPARVVVLILYPQGSYVEGHGLFPAVSDGLLVHGDDVELVAGADTSVALLKKLGEIDQRRASN